MEGHPISVRNWERERMNSEKHFNKNHLLNRDQLIPKLIPKPDFGIQRDHKDSVCAFACVCACDNRITGVICIEHLSRNWKWDREVWRGFRDISPHQSSSHTKTNTHWLIHQHTHTSFPPDNMQMIPPEGHRGSVAVASMRNAFRCGRD